MYWGLQICFHNYYVISFLIVFTGTFPNCTEGSFACNNTEQCIENEYVCDGRVHCKVNGSYADDEDFNLCQSRGAFSVGANHECIEAYRPDGLQIKINATYCDSHIECMNSTDESYSCLPNSGKLQNKYNILFLKLYYSS